MIRDLVVVTLLSFTGVLLSAGPTRADQPDCAPPPAWQRLIVELGLDNPTRIVERALRNKVLLQLERVLEECPGDFVLHRSYWSAFYESEGDDWCSLLEGYRESAESHPDDAASQYAYGVLLAVTKDPRGELHLKRALELQTDSPWPHLALSYHYRYVAYDQQELASHASAFLAACPSYGHAYAYLSAIDDEAVKLEVAPHLRRFLRGQTDGSTLIRLYPELWSIELKDPAPPSRDAVLATIRRDLARVAELTKPPDVATHSNIPPFIDAGIGTKPTVEQWLRDLPMAWDYWLPAGPPVWEAIGGWRIEAHPFPDVELVDLAGRAWTRADFQGHATLVSVWTAGCPPCKVLLPEIQHLHDRFAADSRVRVLTINVDWNPAAADCVVDQQQYWFPVLRGDRSFVGDSFAVPTTWIIDPQGTIRLASIGIVESSTDWAERVATLLEYVASLTNVE